VRLGPRTVAVLLIAVGLAVTVSWLWWRHWWLPLLGVFISGWGTSALAAALGQSPQQREHVRMLREVWALARRLPGDLVLVDPAGGHRLWAEGDHGFLALAVGDPDEAAGVVTRYMLGFAAAPAPAPLFRYIGAHDDPAPTRMSWKQSGELLDYNEQTGAMEAGNTELADLLAQLRRAIAAAHGGRPDDDR
jgi:hypothetical protein